MKHKQQFLAFYVLALSIIVISVGGYQLYKASQKAISTDKPQVNTDSYYAIRNNATELQKTLYKDLQSAIDSQTKDNNTIVSLVASNYVADFYTWTNKLKINDIGGLQFIDASIRTSVYNQAKDTYYVNLVKYLDEKTLDKTLEVSEVSVKDVKQQTLTITNSEDESTRDVDSYVVHLTWTYKESTIVKTSEYDDETYVTLIKNDDGLFYIVEVSHNGEA